MKQLDNIKPLILDLFRSFLVGDISKSKMITELYKFEIELTDFDDIAESDEDIWFKFFRGDTAATTIANIDIDINCPTNGKYIKEMLQIAVDNPQEFQVYYS